MPALIDDGNAVQRAIRTAQTAGTTPDDLFMQDFQLALLRNHIDSTTVDPGQMTAMLQQAWEDPYLQNLYQNEAGYGLTSIATYIGDELFNVNTSHSSDLLTQGLELKQAQGINLPASDLTYLASSGAGSGNAIVNTVMQVAAQLGSAAGMDPQTLRVFENIAVATAYQESGFNPRNIGDSGTSFGLFMLHQGGELGSMTPEQAFDPRTNAQTALAQFVAVWQANPSVVNDPGMWAVAAQRPDNTDNKAANAYNAWYQEVSAGKIPAQKIGPAGLVGNLPPGTVSQYSPIISEYRSLFGKEPDISTLYNILAHGQTAQQWKDYIRTLPSHIPGIAIGQYTDLRSLADSISGDLFGHASNDGIVKELFDQGKLSKTAVNFYYQQMDVAGKMDPKLYNQIYAHAAPITQAIWNGQPNPATIGSIGTTAGGGDQPVSNSDAQKTADVLPLPPQGPDESLVAQRRDWGNIPLTPSPDDRNTRGNLA